MSSSLVQLSRATHSVRGLLPTSLVSARSVHLFSKTGVASAYRASAFPVVPSSASCRQFSITACTRQAQAPQALVKDEINENAAAESIEDEGTTFETFKDRLDPKIYRALTIRPFQLKKPSPVQAVVFDLLPGLSEPHQAGSDAERDLLVKAKTGTGKTLAFLVPAVQQRLNAIAKAGEDASSPQERRRITSDYARSTVGTLIISPTRELATQIAVEAQKLCESTDLEVRLFTGGASRSMQARSFQRGRRDIVVATPGRLTDFLMNNPEVADAMKDLSLLVLDEADVLLQMGFRQDIEQILEFLPKSSERQTFMFSATMSPAVLQVARAALSPKNKFLDIVPAKDHSPVHAHIPQYQTVLDDGSQQIPHVLRLIAHDQLSNPGKSKIIIFFQTTKMTQLFSTILQEIKGETLPAGLSSRFYEIHSKKNQQSRDGASDAFRHDKSGAAILITSDVSARGVDYPGVTRVIQVGVPAGREQYIHRVGRTGRAGMSGRGDIVLLSHESKFVNNVLSDVPVKSISSSDIEQQLRALAEKHDEDPRAFVPSSTPAVAQAGGNYRDQMRQRSPQTARFAQRVMPVVEGVNEKVTGFLDRLDPEAIRETYIALLGFYAGRVEDLRVPRREILKTLEDWTTDGLGLRTPPIVSPLLLTKIGMNPDGSGSASTSFGNRRYGGGGGGGGSRFGVRDGGRDSQQTRTTYGTKRSTSPREREWDSGRGRGGRESGGSRTAWLERGSRGGRNQDF